MKVIDLLNKIANNEEVPKKIKCDGVIYNYEFRNTITGAYDYKSQNYKFLMNNMAEYLYLTDILNNEVEVLEEGKEIEDLKDGDFTDHEMLKQLVCKTRQLISEVNELKKGK